MAEVTRVVAFETSFIHFAASMSATISTLPLCRSTDATVFVQVGFAVPTQPTANHDRSGPEWRSTIPGSVIAEVISMTAPTVRSAPTTSATALVVIPFCTPTITPSGSRYGAIRWAAHRVSYALTTRRAM